VADKNRGAWRKREATILECDKWSGDVSVKTFRRKKGERLDSVPVNGRRSTYPEKRSDPGKGSKSQNNQRASGGKSQLYQLSLTTRKSDEQEFKN